eukprot:1358668-Prymnesium_polylepis.1
MQAAGLVPPMSRLNVPAAMGKAKGNEHSHRGVVQASQRSMRRLAAHGKQPTCCSCCPRRSSTPPSMD